MKKLFSLFFLLSILVVKAQELHPWSQSFYHSIAFNEDQSQMLVVGVERVTLWNTDDGSLLRSMEMPEYEGAPIKVGDFQFIDAAPDLSEFIYKVGSSYQRYFLDIEDRDLFPDFQDRNVKQIVGYDDKGWITFFSEGFYQGFYRVQQRGNMSFIEFLSLEYISSASMSNDHKYILFTRDNTFRYLNVSSKKVTDTGLTAKRWKTAHLEPGWVTLYDWDGDAKDGKEVQWRYFIELGKDPGKRLKGKQAQDYFPNQTGCDTGFSFAFGNTSTHQWSVYYYEEDKDRAKATRQYGIAKLNKSDCSKVIDIIFCESIEANENRKNIGQAAAFAARKKKALEQDAMRTSWYQAYMSKFRRLPKEYILNYNTLAGVDVTSFDFVQNEKYRTGNPQEMAIGRVIECDNGNQIVLRVTRDRSNGMDTQSFRIFKYDPYGKQLKHTMIAQTQKLNGQFPQISYFTLKNNGYGWSASVKIDYQTAGKSRNESFTGTCEAN